jgi:hypothetical protein
MSVNTPFYTNNEENNSVPVDLTNSRGAEVVKKSIIVGSKTEYSDIFVSSTSGFGFPGIPFVPGEPNPASFCQGEDAIFDTFLYYEGKPVVPQNFTISAIVKTSQRATKRIWEGSLNNGVNTTEREGYYKIWIPSGITNTLYGGSYLITVHLEEPVAEGLGPHDRKISLVSTMFNIEYCGDSENPESVSKKNNLPVRGTLGNIWPNSPDTVHG